MRGNGIARVSSCRLALQFFYAKLQSLAFAEDSFDPNQTEDKTLPQVDKMHQVRASQFRPSHEL